MTPLRILFAFLLLGCIAPASWAQTCSSPGAQTLAFSGVNASANTDAQSSITFNCTGGQKPGILRYCIYVQEGSPPATGIAPRRMTNFNGAYLAYDIHSDPARSMIVGPPPSGGGFPVYTGTLSLPGNFTGFSTTFPLYGRVPSGQTVPTGNYQAQIYGSTVAWAFSPTGDPGNCTGGTARGTVGFYLGVAATVSSACRIVSASTLDFGTSSGLGSAITRNSAIQVACPLNTPWTLGLSDGVNAVASTRRMRALSGQMVQYELYSDAALSQRWGNSAGSVVSGTGGGLTFPSNHTVYGRVPAQPSVGAGVYFDSITATLTY